MKQIAALLAAILSLTLVAPALAQPFADVPTDHWAYDAIAELAAKGLIEGYPDGAFRGDRAMTRYEMAMVVARLLARIEAIKIPPLPPDLVRRAELTKAQAADAAARTAIDKRLTAKLATVQRLVAEFRAELAALGVRVTAVEEELAAIRARLDNTRVTGDARVRYNVYPIGTVSGGGTSRQPDVRLRTRVTFTGRAGANVEYVLRLWAANNANATGTNYDLRMGNNYTYGGVSYDLAYIDLRNLYGAKLWRVGRQFYTLVGLGPFGTGLLYDPASSVAAGQFWNVTAGGFTGLPLNMTTSGLSDGIRSDWGLGPLNITAAIFRDANCTVAGTCPTATGLGAGGLANDNRIVHASTGAILPGWTLGGAYYQAWQHATSTGVPSGGTGWQGYITGTLFPGLSIYGEYANWRSIPGPPGTTELPGIKAWRVGGNVNLAQLAGIQQWNPNVDLQYHDYGPVGSCTVANTSATAGTAGAFSSCWPVNTYATTITGQLFAFNMRGWLARLNLTFSPKARGYVLYEWGNTHIPSGGTYSEWWARLIYDIAPRTSVTFNYFRGNGPTLSCVPAAPSGQTCGIAPNTGVLTLSQQDTFNFYRIELLHSW